MSLAVSSSSSRLTQPAIAQRDPQPFNSLTVFPVPPSALDYSALAAKEKATAITLVLDQPEVTKAGVAAATNDDMIVQCQTEGRCGLFDFLGYGNIGL
jgi:hypothetical protein